MMFLAEDAPTATVCIEVPLKRDRVLAEERRRSLLIKFLYALGGILVLSLLLFVGYRLLYPY